MMTGFFSGEAFFKKPAKTFEQHMHEADRGHKHLMDRVQDILDDLEDKVYEIRLDNKHHIKNLFRMAR